MIGKTLLTAAVAFGALAAGTPAAAHQIWIEQQNGAAKLYFGEFGENLREASPGLLDRFATLSGFVTSATGERALTSAKGTDGFALSAAAGKGEALAVEDAAYPVIKRKDGDKEIHMAWTPGARFAADFAKQTPKLALDLTPTGASVAEGVQVALTFKGQPLPKTKVEIVAASGWSQAHRTDDQGLFTVFLPWKGAYVVEVSHSDKTPGTRNGETYDVANYATTLTLVQPDGLQPPAPPPAKAPNKPRQ